MTDFANDRTIAGAQSRLYADDTERALIETVYSAAPRAVVFNLVNALVLLALNIGAVPTPIFVGWIVALVAILALRGAATWRFSRKDRHLHEMRYWRHLAIVIAGLSGAVWAARSWSSEQG